ncbi:Anti-anti-sigma regulatory factor (antagonist of anti-sigma factor) [[Bacillus] enclensis]|uniref:Anti-anti-sigma regulatory factor (Antagonist of anti-sigma factor) n=2 Tax=Rossellomorea TaxID=2837508 RepID=A0A1C4BQG4_9BACI|nr:STAS domain-containing protein [[Bacillus] enclensis]SCC09171.1 Anti-anti-sigma regulatory factor (antagonist of anti-sigma factor) [[Bacillus] enclensis]
MQTQTNMNVEGISFDWNMDTGQFSYEGQDAVLFWISSAMKMFFDTIEEVSGVEAANLVLETTGYRQGLVVGEYFENLKHVGPEEASELIGHTYASAGWGRISTEKLDIKEKTATIYLKDSWEHKINVAQEKNEGGKFLPAHFAGIFTGLFKTNIWYNVIQYQLNGYDCSKVEYYPSDITINNNIHELARKKETEHIRQLEAVVEDKTRDLKELVKALSSPIIPVLEGVVVVPLLGKYDGERAEELVSKTLHNLPSYKANYLILDLTALDEDIDDLSASLIEKIGAAASLIGTNTILVGISAKLGAHIAHTGVDFSRFECFKTLQHGIHFALAQAGRKIV